MTSVGCKMPIAACKWRVQFLRMTAVPRPARPPAVAWVALYHPTRFWSTINQTAEHRGMFVIA